MNQFSSKFYTTNKFRTFEFYKWLNFRYKIGVNLLICEIYEEYPIIKKWRYEFI